MQCDGGVTGRSRSIATVQVHNFVKLELCGHKPMNSPLVHGVALVRHCAAHLQSHMHNSYLIVIGVHEMHG